MQLYGLKLLGVINGEITEKVINKRNLHFRGCDDHSENPTCGGITHNGKLIPYSQGFCCSCNNAKNAKEKLKTDKLKKESDFPENFQEFIYHNIKPDNNIVFDQPRRNKYKRNSDFYSFKDYLRRYNSRKIPREIVYITPKLYRRRYEAPDYSENFEQHPAHPPKIQIRGGQNCNENETIDESAHCPKFSKSWYSVYQISKPILKNIIYVKIFEKREYDNCEIKWFDLTPGSCIEVGSLGPKYINNMQSIQIKYFNTDTTSMSSIFALDPKTKRILVPRASETDENEIIKNPAEFLVVNESVINLSGNTCDTAGVGYKAFFYQPHRCSVPQGSCLKNQPNQLWRRDKRACKRSKRGKYFLKNFARVPDEDVIQITGDNKTKYITLYLDEKVKSVLDIEMKTDDNIIFKNEMKGQITEVYVDATSPLVTVIMIKIYNNGLISNVFNPKLSDCPLELPVDWSNLEGEPVIIPPQHQAIFTMRLFGPISVSKFHCTVEALNARSEVIAMRRVRIIKEDRCICAWHCNCACFKTTGLGCKLLPLEHYKAAGFIGSMPLTTTMVQKNSLDNALFGFSYIILLLTFMLLLIGIAKAVIGLCYVPVGTWGLDILIGLRPLVHYYERNLRCRYVVYDCDGWPLHPDTYQRTVRIVSRSVEFFLNVIFFFTYPIMFLLVISIKMCCPYYPNKIKKSKVKKDINKYNCTNLDNLKEDTDSEDMDQFEFEEITNSDERSNNEYECTNKTCP